MNSSAVSIDHLGDGIARITMHDRVSKNTFSVDLAEGLIAAFAEVSSDERVRAVILTGYDSYFASGGTKEALLYLSEGKGKFTDRDLYSLALACPVPVVAAMQGHGIGGGFVMGLFADFPILTRESIYTTNFMKYGFTPGMGATYIVPHKLGINLAQEMLIAARTYRGEDLHKRGIGLPVLPRAEIAEYALELARTIAEKPRVSLVTLKDQLVAPLRAGLPLAIRQEVAMHETTFHQAEVRTRIEALFGN